MDNIEYLLLLNTVYGLGPARLKNLLDFFGDPKIIWEADVKEIAACSIPWSVTQNLISARKNLDPEKFIKDLEKSNIKWLTIFDENYPKLLKEIYDPPLVLYYQGDISLSNQKAVAIVGTRKMTGYGKIVTEKFASGLSQAGLVVVSGLARGIDTCAHRTAIEINGKTLAVLGGGLKKIFPPENIALAKEIADGKGALISEFAPDEPSLPGNFPARNRIISGLSLAVLVTEAAEDSGSLITAKLALEQGKEVFAIPGPITSELSKGPSVLIKQGAILVTDPAEILDLLGINKTLSKKPENNIKLSKEEQLIWEDLKNETKHVDEICRDLNLAAASVSAYLVKMEIKGLIRNLGGGNYSKI